MSLTPRLTLTYLLVTLGGLLLLGSGIVLLASRYTAQQRERELAAQADVYVGYVTALVRTSAELQALAPNLAADQVLPAETTVRIFASNGVLLSDSAGLGPFPSRPVRELIADPLPLPVSQVASRRYTARPISVAAAPIGIVELSHSTMSEDKLRHELMVMTLQASGIAALAMALISLLTARSIARPIIGLTRRAEEIAADAPMPSRPVASRSVRRAGDEIGMLTQSLEHMASQLQARITEADSGRARLNAVLATISEGVIALDDTQAIIFANPAAISLLGAESIATLDQRLAALDIPRTAYELSEFEVQVDERQLLVTISPASAAATAPGAPSTVLALRDVTRMKSLEQARTRFLRSVSHDLRTPLTAIRGMLENLAETASPDQQPKLMALEGEAARLSRLVNDLLNASATGVLALVERRRIDIGQLAQQLCALQHGRARRAGIILTCRAADFAPVILGDRDRVKQALLNVLDNAMRFTPPGGSVETYIVPSGETVWLVVADSGPGVPPELRERIWERGVRGVELGIGEDDGGSGLGLAIVREIMESHGGRAWVDANEPYGARFVLEFPIVR